MTWVLGDYAGLASHEVPDRHQVFCVYIIAPVVGNSLGDTDSVLHMSNPLSGSAQVLHYFTWDFQYQPINQRLLIVIK